MNAACGTSAKLLIEMTATEPGFAFDDSRRLTGPNRWSAGTAVILTPLGLATHDGAAHARWAARVGRACTQLGWPDPQAQALPHPREPLLVFSAPAHALFTATAINEWAWERSAAEAGETGFDLAHDLARESEDRPDEEAAAWAHFAARAAAEDRPDLRALCAAAISQGLPALVDDEQLSLGAGTGSLCWPLLVPVLVPVVDANPAAAPVSEPEPEPVRLPLPAPAAVPWVKLHDVPTALVTGSNGKTTTVRLLAAIARTAGLSAGLSSTEGVFIEGTCVASGDYSGPAGARAVLRHPSVQLAVLETARGGLMRRGLAVDRADAAVVTNVSADHLGEYGIDNLQDIAHAKLVVARALAPRSASAAGGTLVLNGADPVLMAVARATPHVQALAAQGQLALFARDFDHPELAALRQAGGGTCGVLNDRLLWQRAQANGGHRIDLGVEAELPLTLHGAAPHNTENIAAAVLVAAALGLPDAAIRDTLARFGSNAQDNPGRLERWTHHGATVLIDYAHNPDGLAQLLRVARALQPARLGLLLGQAGNRDDAAITELARAAAAAQPDRIVIKELPGMLRGRQLGEVPGLIERALRAAGHPAERLHQVADEAAAANALLDWSQPGDVLVLPVHTSSVRALLAPRLQA